MKTYKVIVMKDFTKWYNESNQLHRENGPAIEWADGNKGYYINGKLHREDGPAIEWASGSKLYFVNGKRLTEQQFNNRNKSCEGKVVEIEGVKYKLTKI